MKEFWGRETKRGLCSGFPQVCLGESEGDPIACTPLKEEWVVTVPVNGVTSTSSFFRDATAQVFWVVREALCLAQ